MFQPSILTQKQYKHLGAYLSSFNIDKLFPIIAKKNCYSEFLRGILIYLTNTQMRSQQELAIDQSGSLVLTFINLA